MFKTEHVDVQSDEPKPCTRSDSDSNSDDEPGSFTLSVPGAVGKPESEAFA